MSIIDIAAVKSEALKQINDEAVKSAKETLVRQMRVVAAAEQVLRAEKVKLADIEARIEEGTI